MICQTCRTSLSLDAKVCPNCGTSISTGATDAPTRTPVYSKTIFLGLIAAITLAVMLFGLGSDDSTNPFLAFLFHLGASLFLGVLISVLIVDWKGFVSLEGLLHWKRMERNTRNAMGCLFVFFFPFFFILYLLRASINVFRSEGPVFSRKWDAPQPIKRRAQTGIAAGIIVALITLAFATGTYTTQSGGASTGDVVLTTTTPVVTSLPTPTPVPSPMPTPMPTFAPTPAPTPTAAFAQFGDGTYVVGQDIQPGTYRLREASSGCYYARLSGFSGTMKDIIANSDTGVPAIITIAPTDKGFQASNCGTWTKDLSAITTNKTSFTDGMYIIGTDIEPGTYKSSGQSGCYYARLSGFSETTKDIIANDNTDTPAIITIAPTDRGFQSSDCGTWKKS